MLLIFSANYIRIGTSDSLVLSMAIYAIGLTLKVRKARRRDANRIDQSKLIPPGSIDGNGPRLIYLDDFETMNGLRT